MNNGDYPITRLLDYPILMSFIEVSGISKTFRSTGAPREVLRDVTLSVDRGEFVSIVGMMGCGKSTFLKIVAGLLAPDAGSVTVDGESVRGSNRGTEAYPSRTFGRCCVGPQFQRKLRPSACYILESAKTW